MRPSKKVTTQVTQIVWVIQPTFNSGVECSHISKATISVAGDLSVVGDLVL